jgi:hypothetical protein
MDGVPAKYFAFPPYRAEDLGGDKGWWGVMNRNGLNVLTFPDKPGAVVTSEENAKRLAAEWNEGAVFIYPPDPYVAPVTTRLTDAQMAKYIRSQRLVGDRWVSPIVLLGGGKSGAAIEAYVET